MRRTRIHVARQAFTLVELLIVITIIGLLVAIIWGASVATINRQKLSVTQQIFNSVSLVLDQFKEENSLARLYDRRNAATFGAYPPYQLDNPDSAATLQNSVSEAVEPDTAADQYDPPVGLRERFARDFSVPLGNVVIEDSAADRIHHDNRALYVYLAAYAPKMLSQVPPNAIKPLTDQSEYVDPSTGGNENSRIPVLGLHDAWGVPLDYMLYVKLEWSQIVNPATGAVGTGLRVVDRMPVLRSRGVAREVFDVLGNATDKSTWKFSSEFPSPSANVDAQGDYQASNSSGNGWVRARALGEIYGYVPSQDN